MRNPYIKLVQLRPNVKRALIKNTPGSAVPMRNMWPHKQQSLINLETHAISYIYLNKLI